MIHTVDIRKEIRKEEYYRLKETYDLLPVDNPKYRKNIKSRLYLPNDNSKLIKIEIFRYKPYKYYKYYIKASFDLHRLSNHDNLQTLLEPDDIKAGMKKFNEIIEPVLGQDYLIDAWEISRVDFTWDIPFEMDDDNDIIQHYIDLLNKAFISNYHNEHYKESFYLKPVQRNTNSFSKLPNINFYHKMKKLRNSVGFYEPKSEDYVLRLEVQCTNAKYMLETLNGKNKKDNVFKGTTGYYTQFLSADALCRLMLNSLQSIYDRILKANNLIGDFYTLNEAINIINCHVGNDTKNDDPFTSNKKGCILTPTKTNNIKQTLREISKEGSVEKYMERKNKPSKRTVKEYFGILNELNISPVLISDSESVEWKSSHLEGLHKKIDDILCNYMYKN